MSRIRKPFYGDFSRFEARIGPDGKDYNHQTDCPQHANPDTELPCMCTVDGTYPQMPEWPPLEENPPHPRKGDDLKYIGKGRIA